MKRNVLCPIQGNIAMAELMRRARSNRVYCLVNAIYHLVKCIFHPVMFSPLQTREGICVGAGKHVAARSFFVSI